MCIVDSSPEDRGTRAASRRQGLKRLHLAVGMALLAPGAVAMAQVNYSVQLPSIGATDYKVTVSNPNIDGGVTYNSSATNAVNTTCINDYLAYAAAHGGGTVEFPNTVTTYQVNELFLGNNTNLQVDTGATLLNAQGKLVFINNLTTNEDNLEISGGGTIEDFTNATTSSSSNNHMVLLQNVTNLEVYDVSLENASNEHLVIEGDNNVLVNDVTIQDAKLQANTDGIDFAGSNYLIENCNIEDDDDDIVAKPQNTYCSNIYIQNITITNGHGISIGGQTNMGLNGMFVNNVTINMVNQSEATAIDLKSGPGNGGLVQNVTFNNIAVNNVDDVLFVSSDYNSNSGSESYVTTPYTPAANEPFWTDITMENMTVNDASSNAAHIYGLNTSNENVNELNFINMVFTNTAGNWNMYFANNVYCNGVTVNGTTIADSLGNYKDSESDTVAEELDDTFTVASNPNGVTNPAGAGIENPVYLSNVPTLTPANVPEPASISALGALTMMLLPRRNRSRGAQRHPIPQSPADSP